MSNFGNSGKVLNLRGSEFQFNGVTMTPMTYPQMPTFSTLSLVTSAYTTTRFSSIATGLSAATLIASLNPKLSAIQTKIDTINTVLGTLAKQENRIANIINDLKED